MSVLVLGTGIVGSAAIWDLGRRGHAVAAADVSAEAQSTAADRFGIAVHDLDVTDREALERLMAPHDLVVSAVPYRFGVIVTEAAIATGTHCLDFGGNPTVVAGNLEI